VDYDRRGINVVTWAEKILMSWKFWDAYVDEAYAVLSPDWITDETAPSGFDLAHLREDLAQVTGG
jgi:hypothetical protein